MNLNDLATFVLVGECGSFAEAARRLGVPKSTVSRRVARLEAELETALLVRSVRGFALSEDGQALAERCTPALREISDAERNLTDADASPRGRLRVSSTADFGNSRFTAELVAAYSRRHPDVRVELSLGNRMVDLMEEGFDIAFRTHAAPLQSRDDLIARRLGTIHFGVFASPAFVADHPLPSALPEAGPGVPVAAHDRAHRGWLGPSANVTVDDYQPLARMLEAGAGVGVLPEFVAAPAVRGGRLVRVDLGPPIPPASLSLVWLRSRHLAPRVRAFIELAVARTRAAGWLTAGGPQSESPS